MRDVQESSDKPVYNESNDTKKVNKMIYLVNI